MGETYFCKGRNDLRTDITETCLGSLYLQQGQGIQKNCKFEITAAKEQVFRLAHNKWAIEAQKQFTTVVQVCVKDIKPEQWDQAPLSPLNLIILRKTLC